MSQMSTDSSLVFSTASSAYFADLIAKHLGVERGNVIRKTFGDGEEYYRVDIQKHHELMGKNIVYVSSTNKDVDMLELIRVGSGLGAGCGVRRIIFCIPFLGYSTMERAVHPGEVVTAKVNARLLSAIPQCTLNNVFLFLDLHVSGLLHYFVGDTMRTELYGERVLVEGIKSLGLEDNMIFASADLGRPLWVQSFAKCFNTDLAFVRKSRSFDQTKVVDVIGDVQGKNVIIYDDMTRSGGTLIHAAEAYMERGALSVYAVLSHFALTSSEVIERLLSSCIVAIVATNSHPMSQHALVKAYPERFKIVDVSTEFVSAIKSHLLN